MSKRKRKRGQMGQANDFSFMSVSTGSFSAEFRGIEFTYRVPTAEEEDEFTSIQFRQVTEGRSLADTLAGSKAKSAEKKQEKVIPFSKLPLKRFQALCTGWTPNFQVNGTDLPFSPENVQTIIEDLPKLAQQVDSVVWAKYTEALEEEEGN